MEIEDLNKDKENVKNKQQKKLKIVLIIIGVVLIFSALRSCYYTYEGINTETIVIFFIGLICIFSHFILKFINTKKTDELKYKILKMSKRNIIKIATICFWGYLGLSLIAVLKEVFLTPNWSQIATQYSQLEIILECTIFIIGRCDFKKSTNYFNIFWI